MSLKALEFTVHPNKDFTRKKKWDFATVLKFIISMESQSLKNELHKYFGYTADCPSTASFNQRRAQIRAEALQSLFEQFSVKYNNTTQFFKEYRLIACDGSDTNIAHNPNDKESYFTNGNVQGFNQLHLNAMFDLLGKTYTDAIIQPGKIENEHKAFCDMVDRYNGKEIQPNGLLLSYPVITSGTYAHHGSMENLMGTKKSKELEELLSLEHQVGKQVPPVFIWHTLTDQSVPVQNTLMFTEELVKNQVSVEVHIFPEGQHGLSLANEEMQITETGFGIQKRCQDWITLAGRWVADLEK